MNAQGNSHKTQWCTGAIYFAQGHLWGTSIGVACACWNHLSVATKGCDPCHTILFKSRCSQCACRRPAFQFSVFTAPSSSPMSPSLTQRLTSSLSCRCLQVYLLFLTFCTFPVDLLPWSLIIRPLRNQLPQPLLLLPRIVSAHAQAQQPALHTFAFSAPQERNGVSK